MNNVIELYEQNKELYTDSRILINDFVKKGRTKLFNDELEAENYSKLNNTYHYIVYDNNNRSVGFAVAS